MINVVCGIRSTGRICTDIATELQKQGHEVTIAYGREHVPDYCKKYAHRIGSDWDVKIHGVKSRLLDRCGFGSTIVTKRFISWIEQYNPDVIHLHNIHGYYIDIRVLFTYLKRSGKRIIWTLHDCWAFTGHCTYFDYISCFKWKTECCNCPNRKAYPTSLIFDMSRRNYIEKKELFTNIPNMTLVTPSKWLAELVNESFLKEYPIRVINNGIDTSIFKPTDSNLREKLEIGNRKVILGVAAIWNERKGLTDFIKLSGIVSEDYVIVMIGLTQNQIESLPDGIIGVTRTDSPRELAEYYSLANVFFNPTYEDNYPTTNLEAISCGTPVVTYKTGGSCESAVLWGCFVDKGDVYSAYEKILCINNCVREAYPISKTEATQEYIGIYLGDYHD